MRGLVGLLRPQFAPQHLANAAWSFAELQVHWTFDELLLELGPELEQEQYVKVIAAPEELHQLLLLI